MTSLYQLEMLGRRTAGCFFEIRFSHQKSRNEILVVFISCHQEGQDTLLNPILIFRTQIVEKFVPINVHHLGQLSRQFLHLFCVCSPRSLLILPRALTLGPHSDLIPHFSFRIHRPALLLLEESPLRGNSWPVFFFLLNHFVFGENFIVSGFEVGKQLVVISLQTTHRLLQPCQLDMRFQVQISRSHSHCRRCFVTPFADHLQAPLLEPEISSTVVFPELSESLDSCESDLQHPRDDSPPQNSLLLLVKHRVAFFSQFRVCLFVSTIGNCTLLMEVGVLGNFIMDVYDLFELLLTNQQAVGVVTQSVVLFLTLPDPLQENRKIVFYLLPQFISLLSH